MSRSRREKQPDLRCNFQWEPLDGKTALVPCPHVCSLPVDHAEDEHFCCRSVDGIHAV